MGNNSKLVSDLKLLRNTKYNNPPNEKPAEEAKPEIILPKITVPEPPSNYSISMERLQEAVIWSEILGKPLSKRRKRRV